MANKNMLNFTTFVFVKAKKIGIYHEIKTVKRGKKVVSPGLEPMDFCTCLVDSVLHLHDEQVKFLGKSFAKKFKLQVHCRR